MAGNVRTAGAAVVIFGVAAALVTTTVLVVVVDGLWPQDDSRFVVGSNWLGWALVLGIVHLTGGVVGGAATAGWGSDPPIGRIVWVGAVVFVTLSIPALGAFDRPVELASMTVLNVISVVGVLGGGLLIVRRRSKKAP